MNIINWIQLKLLDRRAKKEEETPVYREAKRLVEEIQRLRESLTAEKLLLARQELLEWREAHSTDYRGRPFLAPKCKCGVVLQHWPQNDDYNRGIWCATLHDQADYDAINKGGPDADFYRAIEVRHDIRDDSMNLLKAGKCTADPKQ